MSCDITVIVPVWGEYVRHLPAALGSLREQAVECRVIVVDNASEPPVVALPGVEVLRSPERLSVGAARNLGLAEVRSPFVLFWDADDTMLPGTLKLLRNGLTSSPALVGFGAAIVERPGGPPHRWPRRRILALARRRHLFAVANCVWALYPITGATLLRTDAVVDAGGCADLDRGEDALLAAPMALRGRLAFSAVPGRVYSQGDRSLASRPLTDAELLAQGRAIRRRVAEDDRTPTWMRVALPLAGVIQWLTVRLLRSPVRRLRRGETA